MDYASQDYGARKLLAEWLPNDKALQQFVVEHLPVHPYNQSNLDRCVKDNPLPLAKIFSINDAGVEALFNYKRMVGGTGSSYSYLSTSPSLSQLPKHLQTLIRSIQKAYKLDLYSQIDLANNGIQEDQKDSEIMWWSGLGSIFPRLPSPYPPSRPKRKGFSVEKPAKKIDPLKEDIDRKLNKLGFFFDSFESPTQLLITTKFIQYYCPDCEWGYYDEGLVAAVNRVYEYQQDVISTAQGKLFPRRDRELTNPILASVKLGNDFFALVENKVGKRPILELWGVNKNNEAKSLALGENAIEYIEQVTQGQIARLSDRKISFFHVGSLNRDTLQQSVPLQFATQGVLASPAEIHRFLQGEGDVPIFDALFAPLQGSRQQVIVCRDIFFQAPLGKVTEENLFLSGRYHLNRDHPNPVKLMMEMKRRYGKYYDFLLDDKLEVAYSNALGLPTTQQGSDLAIYTSPKVEDWDIIPTLSDILEKANIDIKNVNLNSKSTILVITGHNNSDFKAFLEELGKQNILEGKVVVLFSCYQAGDEFFNSHIIAKYGAKAILFFPEKIHPQAVENILKELSQLLGPTVEKRRIDAFLEQAIDRTLQDSKLTDFLRQELEKLRRAIIQLSKLELTRPSSQST